MTPYAKPHNTLLSVLLIFLFNPLTHADWEIDSAVAHIKGRQGHNSRPLTAYHLNLM